MRVCPLPCTRTKPGDCTTFDTRYCRPIQLGEENCKNSTQCWAQVWLHFNRYDIFSSPKYVSEDLRRFILLISVDCLSLRIKRCHKRKIWAKTYYCMVSENTWPASRNMMKEAYLSVCSCIVPLVHVYISDCIWESMNQMNMNIMPSTQQNIFSSLDNTSSVPALFSTWKWLWPTNLLIRKRSCIWDFKFK